MAIKVLFHSLDGVRHCPDGFGAAYAAWREFRYREDIPVHYIPCVYEQPAPLIEKGDTVFLLDFSYPRDVLLAWNEIAEVTVLDHHKTAQADLEGLPFAQFDMTRSGAQMAWKHFQPTWEMPDLIRYIADRDLWKKQLPHTEEIHLALSSLPQDFVVWDTLSKINYVEFMRRVGAPLLEKRRAEIEELVETAQWREFGVYRALSTNTDRYSLVSDALNVLCQRHPETPFAFNFFERDGMTKYELRSVGDFDVSVLAKQQGGGGHKNAAGCSLSIAEGGHRNDHASH